MLCGARHKEKCFPLKIFYKESVIRGWKIRCKVLVHILSGFSHHTWVKTIKRVWIAEHYQVFRGKIICYIECCTFCLENCHLQQFNSIPISVMSLFFSWVSSLAIIISTALRISRTRSSLALRTASTFRSYNKSHINPKHCSNALILKTDIKMHVLHLFLLFFS